MNTRRTFPVHDYDLDATLNSGQAFRWQFHDGEWIGVIGGRWVSLSAQSDSVIAQTAEPVSEWRWLTDYLQIEIDLGAVLKTFPDDEPMRAAVGAHRGLRLLRQDPWECLASFILSSTKQIVQIRQIVSLLCERFGEPVCSGGLRPSQRLSKGAAPAVTDRRYNSFPTPQRIATLTEADLRACKMGFRAPYLLDTARMIASGEIDLERLRGLTVTEARAELMRFPGVGKKIADCVLLFAYGFQSAFPVDVWVIKALQQLYFPKRRASLKRLHRFTETYFGPNAGYAQQYLFHYMRMKKA